MIGVMTFGVQMLRVMTFGIQMLGLMSFEIHVASEDIRNSNVWSGQVRCTLLATS